MKVFALILAVCIIGAFADVEDEKMKQYKEECITETGVDRAVVDKLKNDEGWDMENPQLRCLFKCIMKKAGYMKEDESYDTELMKKNLADDLPADKLDDTVKTCAAITAADACEKAMKTTKCFIEHSAFAMHDI